MLYSLSGKSGLRSHRVKIRENDKLFVTLFFTVHVNRGRSKLFEYLALN